MTDTQGWWRDRLGRMVSNFNAVAYRWSPQGFVPKMASIPLVLVITPAWFVVVVASGGCKLLPLALTVTHKWQLMRNACITGQVGGNVSRVLPDSNPVMDSKVLMVCTRGIKDVYSHFSWQWKVSMDKSSTMVVLFDAVPNDRNFHVSILQFKSPSVMAYKSLDDKIMDKPISQQYDYWRCKYVYCHHKRKAAV